MTAVFSCIKNDKGVFLATVASKRKKKKKKIKSSNYNYSSAKPNFCK